jgi:hypothetical protein
MTHNLITPHALTTEVTKRRACRWKAKKKSVNRAIHAPVRGATIRGCTPRQEGVREREKVEGKN